MLNTPQCVTNNPSAEIKNPKPELQKNTISGGSPSTKNGILNINELLKAEEKNSME